MKTHRSTQLFLYFSGGERSVKCVRPALEMEASKEEQRGVARFLVAESAATRHKVKTPWNSVGRNHPFAWIMPVPILSIWRGISFRDLAGKHFNILRTAQIFLLVTSTLFGDLKKDIRGRRFHSDEKVQEWVCCGSISDLPLSTRLELIVSYPSGINVLSLLAITFE